MTWGLDSSHVHDKGQTVGAAVGNTPEERHRAVRVVAANSGDAVECAMVLEILGLTASDGRRDRGDEAA